VAAHLRARFGALNALLQQTDDPDCGAGLVIPAGAVCHRRRRHLEANFPIVGFDRAAALQTAPRRISTTPPMSMVPAFFAASRR
jgi:hypothetical protein